MTTLGGDDANDKVDAAPKPTQTGRREVGDYPLPLLSLIAQGLEPYGADIFIGGTAAARDIGLLRQHGISTVVNCAVNLDVNYVDGTGRRRFGVATSCRNRAVSGLQAGTGGRRKSAAA